MMISQRFPAITLCERQWTGRKARRDRGLAAAPEFIDKLGHRFPRMVSPYRSRKVTPARWPNSGGRLSELRPLRNSSAQVRAVQDNGAGPDFFFFLVGHTFEG